MAKNNWFRSEFPNFKLRSGEIDIKTNSAKRALEYLFSNRIGNLLDEFCFSVIVGFWKRKFRHIGEKNFSLNFRSQKNVSKHHPNAFQTRVVNKYLEKIDWFEQSTGFSLAHSPELKTIAR
jgi:hypothetical protein